MSLGITRQLHRVHTIRPPLRRAPTVLMALSLFISTVGCKRPERIMGRRIDDKNQSQIVSLSVAGSEQASVLLQKTGEVKLTTDGGKSWQVVPVVGVGDDIAFAKMIDAKRGWAANRRGQVFKTDSGGLNWIPVTGLKDITGVAQIEFVNENDGWMREFLSIWRTNDGGITWREKLSVLTPGVFGQPTGMSVIDANRVIVSGEQGQVFKTTDGGENWKIETPITADNIDYYDVWFADKEHGWIAGYQVLVAGESGRPVLLETVDGGTSWKELSVGIDIQPSSVCFVGDEGWLAGSRRIVNDRSVELRGVLLRSRDGGNSWTPVRFDTETNFFSRVRFTDEMHGWLLGSDRLYRTDDGGDSWHQVLTVSSAQ
jgi:photosystem II stability/assembly factor-like uncharacterized protein